MDKEEVKKDGMVDVGMEREISVEPSSNEDSKKSYPTVYIPGDALKGKEVGETCILKVVGKIVGENVSENRNEKTIEIHKIGYIGKGSKSKEDYMKMSEQEKDEYDEKSTEE